MTQGLSEKKVNTLSGNILALLEGAENALQEKGYPADLFLRKAFRENRKFGSRDRHAITFALFAYFRWHGWIMKAWDGRTQPERMLLTACLLEGTEPVTAALWCRETGTDPEFYHSLFELSGPEARLNAFTGKDCKVSNADLVPGNMLKLLASGAEEHFLPYLRSRPPVWIRIQKHTDRVLKEFDSHGITYEKDSRLPGACKLGNHAKVNLCMLESFKSGCFEVQDYASQCIGYATEAKGPEVWWAACSGAGGKTLLLASLLKEGGKITASDIREKKLEELQVRADRGGFRNIRTLPWDQGIQGQYDGVLADAPCSSSGRWRRNPEMRLTATEEWVRSLADLQLEILEKVKHCVKPGGYLVYGTCSVFDCENNGVAKAFLERNPEFEPAAFLYDGKPVTALQTFPGEADCDGTFCAKFRRKMQAE